MIGVDQSLTSTGLVVWDGQAVLSFRNIKTTPAQVDEERLDLIQKEVIGAVKKHQPKLVVLEAPAPRAAPGNDSRPHMVTGILRWRLWRLEQPFVLVAPNTLKKFGAGNGSASKEQMLAAAREVWPQCTNHDVADAFHLARYGSEFYDLLTVS